MQFLSSPDAIKAWTEKQALANADSDAFRFQIEVIETGAVAGTVNIHNCNPRVGTFMYGIAIAPEHTRKGYASDAIKLLRRYYFEEKRYQKVTAGIYSFNDASIVLHE